MILCEFGCGNEAKFKLKSGKDICQKSSNQCPVNKEKNSLGLKNKHSEYKSIGKNFYNYDLLPDEVKRKMSWNKGNITADFSENTTKRGQHKQILINERGHKCEKCFNTHWLNNIIPLELEHIDGNNRNNLKENLLLLCPNCHALTDTWRGRNINTGKRKVTDEELIDAINNSPSIRQALISVNLTPKGGNYIRCNNLIFEQKCSLKK